MEISYSQKNMTIIGMVAMAENFAIGRGGSVPWKYPSDMKFFQQKTTGHVIVMGSRTWDSLPRKPLPNRLNVVLTRRSVDSCPPGVLYVNNVQSVISLSKYLSKDLYIIGGGEIYDSFRNHIDQWVITEIPVDVEGADTFLSEEVREDIHNNFQESSTQVLDGNLTVKVYERLH